MVESSSAPSAGASVPPLGALIQLVRGMGFAREARDMYGPAMSALQSLLGVDRCSILLLDEEGVARFVDWTGLSDEYRAAVEGHFPWRVDDPAPQPVLVSDIEDYASLGKYLPLLRREGIRALAFIPLIFGARLVGKFMLYYDRPHAFQPEEVELASVVAYLVAFGIERERLHEALAEADRRKDTFLATLAHELRNPLAPVSAALSLMAERPDDALTCRQSREVLDRNVRKMVRLVDDLLDVSRVTRGVIAIEKQPTDLASLVELSVDQVRPLIESQHHELRLSLEPLWVMADPLRLEQVITNLLHNAAKYTPPGGHIQIATRARHRGVEIRVRDDGIGIEPATVPRLFELFVQVDQSLARTKGGLGIGLTIVRELVVRHGGTISARSEGVGRGTEFIVWLPERIDARKIAPPPSQQQLQSSPGRAEGPTRNILVVDDNEDAANSLAQLLESWRHRTAVVSDGPSALETVAETHPEVVLLDLGLPGMSGYEVAERLRAAGERDLRIVAISGYGQPEDVARARQAGCDAHLTKPVDLDRLRQVLGEGGPRKDDALKNDPSAHAHDTA